MTSPGGGRRGDGRGEDVSAELRRRVMRAVRAEPKGVAASRRSRRVPVASALSVAGVLGVLGMLGVLAVVGRVAVRSTRAPDRLIPASVGLARAWVSSGRGDLIITHLPPPPANRVYQLWLQRGTGAPAPGTLFTVTSRETAVVGLPAYAAGCTRVLVTVEPAGGSPAPTSRPVIVASLV